MNICFTISKTLVINSNLIRSIRRSISTVMGVSELFDKKYSIHLSNYCYHINCVVLL